MHVTQYIVFLYYDMVGESGALVTIMNRRLIELYAINSVKSIQKKTGKKIKLLII